MAIKYYPNRVFKKLEHAIDRIRAKRLPIEVAGHANVTGTGLDVVVSATTDWQLDSIKFNFSNATSRNYAAKILTGRKVLADLNDFLWFQTPQSLWQKITLRNGFYTGAQLATELQTQLDANTEFAALGLTFTVAYSSTTGLFTITPSSGTLKYIEHKVDFPLPDQYSIGGHLFGLTANTSFGSTVVSDTPVFGLGTEAWIIDQTSSTVTEHYHDDLHILSLDQAVHLTTNTAATVVDYVVIYENMV